MNKFDTSTRQFNTYRYDEDKIQSTEIAETIAEICLEWDYSIAITAWKDVQDDRKEEVKKELEGSSEPDDIERLNAIDDPDLEECVAILKQYAKRWHRDLLDEAQRKGWPLHTIRENFPVRNPTDDSVELSLQSVIDWLKERGDRRFVRVMELKRQVTCGNTTGLNHDGLTHIDTTSVKHLWPWGYHNTKALNYLVLAANRFWVNWNPEESDTAHTIDDIADWLAEKYNVSDNRGRAIGSILRPENLPPGPRSKRRRSKEATK